MRTLLAAFVLVALAWPCRAQTPNADDPRVKGAMARAAARADDLERALEVSQEQFPMERVITMAVGITADGRVVISANAGSGRLDLAKLINARLGERFVAGAGHAEANLVASGERFVAIAATRPICDKCEDALNSAGVVPVPPCTSGGAVTVPGNPRPTNAQRRAAGGACRRAAAPAQSAVPPDIKAVISTQPYVQNGENRVRVTATNVHLIGEKLRRVRIGFNMFRGTWIGEAMLSREYRPASDDQPIPPPDQEYYVTRERLAALGHPHDPFRVCIVMNDAASGAELASGCVVTPLSVDQNAPPPAAPPPAGPAVYGYTNPAGSVSVQLTDGTADQWGTLTGHGSFLFLGARLECALIVERHLVYGSDPKTYDYATKVKPGPGCAAPYRFTGVDGVADFQSQDFFSYPNGYGYLYLNQAIASVNINGVRAQAAKPADLAISVDAAVPHISFNLSGNDVQYGRFHFSPGGFNVWKDGVELKMDSGYATVDGQSAQNLMQIRWQRQGDGYHLQYGFGSEWTAKLPQYGIH